MLEVFGGACILWLQIHAWHFLDTEEAKQDSMRRVRQVSVYLCTFIALAIMWK